MFRFLKILGVFFVLVLLFQFFNKEEGFDFQASLLLNERVIVAFGDSLTEGYELPEEQSYPSQLEQKLLNLGLLNTHVVNMGVSGDTTKGGLIRIKSLLRENPDIVILALGANDGLRNVKIQETEQNLRKIIIILQERDIDVLLVGIEFPLLMGALGYTGDYKGLYKDLSKEFDIPLVPNILEDVMNKQALNLPDGKHPNEAGYRIVVENIWEELKEML